MPTVSNFLSTLFKGNKYYSEMSNIIRYQIKPFGTLRDFGAGYPGHYETFLYGHRLRPFETLRDFWVRHYKSWWKISLRVLCTLPT